METTDSLLTHPTPLKKKNPHTQHNPHSHKSPGERGSPEPPRRHPLLGKAEAGASAASPRLPHAAAHGSPPRLGRCCSGRGSRAAPLRPPRGTLLRPPATAPRSASPRSAGHPMGAARSAAERGLSRSPGAGARPGRPRCARFRAGSAAAACALLPRPALPGRWGLPARLGTWARDALPGGGAAADISARSQPRPRRRAAAAFPGGASPLLAAPRRPGRNRTGGCPWAGGGHGESERRWEASASVAV